MKILNNAKDAVIRAKNSILAKAARLYFNKSFKSIGIMTKLQIDSKNNTVHLELDLRGEQTPITIDVARYTLSSQGGKTQVELSGIKTSREWINVLLDHYVKQKPIEVPGFLKVLL